jgi:hypothetical protein
MFSVGIVQRSYLEDKSTLPVSQISVEHSGGKFVVEEELEVGL